MSLSTACTPALPTYPLTARSSAAQARDPPRRYRQEPAEELAIRARVEGARRAAVARLGALRPTQTRCARARHSPPTSLSRTARTHSPVAGGFDIRAPFPPPERGLTAGRGVWCDRAPHPPHATTHVNSPGPPYPQGLLMLGLRVTEVGSSAGCISAARMSMLESASGVVIKRAAEKEKRTETWGLFLG